MLENSEAMASSEPPLEYDPVWRQTFPNRNTFVFENGVRITSEFESGNLWKCQEFLPGQENIIPEEIEEEKKEADGSQGVEDASDVGEDDNTMPNGEGEGYDEHDVATLFAPT